MTMEEVIEKLEETLSIDYDWELSKRDKRILTKNK